MSPPTESQRSLAALLSVDLAGDTFDSAAARLLDAVSTSVGLEPQEPASERQKAFAKSLGAVLESESKRVASAIIGQLLHERNQEAIARLQLSAGDWVVRTQRIEIEGETHILEQEFVISSVQPNGRVFFKGGNGQGAWPTQLRKSAA